MRILFLILLYMLSDVSDIENRLIIKDAGISTISKGDIGMLFYVVVENRANISYNVIVKMEKCCEQFATTDMDCQMMQLIGGNMGTISPKQTKHLSLIYPNMYLHNRYGQCLILVKYRIYTQLKIKVEFDTTLDRRKLNPVLRGYYSKKQLKLCTSIDLDPLDNCAPVNCEMKYLGSRNFFNHFWNRCQKVPICITDASKDLPDVSYVPICNQCKDLESVLTAGDIEYLQTGKIEECWESQVAPLLSANIRCHHGVLNNETGFCICAEGWMTSPIDKDQYEPGLSVYHMCNMKMYTWKETRNTKLKQTFIMIGIAGAVIAVTLLLISLCCHLLYKFMFYPYLSTTPPTSFTDISTLSDDLFFARAMDATSVLSYFNMKHYSCMAPFSEDTIYRITELNEGVTQTEQPIKHTHAVQIGGSYEIESSDSDES